MDVKGKTYQHVLDAVKESSQSLRDEMSERLNKIEEKVHETPDWKQLYEQAKAEAAAKSSQEANEKGDTLGGVVRCILQSRLTHKSPLAIAEKSFGSESRVTETVTKALEAQNATAGGFLVEDEVAREVIELLRAQSIVLASNPRVVPLDRGTLTLPKHTTGVSGSWLGEGSNLTHTQPAFGQVQLVAHKYGALTSISNDLIRYATPDVDRLVRDDLVRDAALATDLAYIRGTGAAAEPRGLENIDGINTFAANGTVNLANVTVDLGRAIRELVDDNVSISTGSTGWMIAPRTWQYLFTVRDGNGNLVFKDEMDGGTLFGYPWKMTTQIPTNLGGGTDESIIYLVNWPDVIVGMASSIELDASSEAAYHDGSSVQASFSLDQSVVRAIVRTDINVRHPESVLAMTGVTWAA